MDQRFQRKNIKHTNTRKNKMNFLFIYLVVLGLSCGLQAP